MVDTMAILARMILMQHAVSMQGRQIGFLSKPEIVSNRNDMPRATRQPCPDSDVFVLCE